MGNHGWRFSDRFYGYLGRTGIDRSGSGSAIEPKIVFSHQFHPFSGGYDRAAPGIKGMKAGADECHKHEKDCNSDGCVNHNGLFASEIAIELDSVALCNGQKAEYRLFLS